MNGCVIIIDQDRNTKNPGESYEYNYTRSGTSNIKYRKLLFQ